MDAVVIIDPAEYKRMPGEAPRAVGLRTLPFGEHSQGLITFLIYPPDGLVLVVKIQWIGDWQAAAAQNAICIAPY